MNDAYGTIARCIDFIVAHQTGQPSLTQIAAHVGLSESHLHRTFVAWAGVTPKDFLQCLTAAHARDALRQGESVMAAAFDSGLSGPGRLHDLCVELEAATPGEIKSGGTGLTIEHGIAGSPFGTVHLAMSERGICHVAFVDATPARGESRSVSEAQALAELRAQWPNASLKESHTSARWLTDQLFSKAPHADRQSPLRGYVKGSAFQVKVWRALLRIPEGSLATYADIARAVDAPKAARAVGSAVASNGLGYLIPCHRVIRATGVVGDYRWGTVRKRAMLARESTLNAPPPNTPPAPSGH